MDKLITYLKAERGRLTALAKELNITPGAINQWRQVPDDKLLDVERVTCIPRQELRPDLFEGMKHKRRRVAA